MNVLRTPRRTVRRLPGSAFSPHDTVVASGDGSAPLRIHHLDEGPADAAPLLLMHGEPSWCYLYRTTSPRAATRIPS